MLRKFGIIAVLSLMAVAIAAVPALAQQGLHFVGTPTITATKTDTTAFLTSSGEVAGAGQFATASLSATANVTTGCVNRGSMDQQPSGLQRTSQPVSGTSPVDFTRPGRGTFTVQTDPVILDRTCPDQMTPVFVSVVFTDVTLTVTAQTGEITYNFGTIDP